MNWTTRDKAIYYLLRWGGIAIMLVALGVSFGLPLPSRLRFAVTGVIGLIGWGVAGLARNFKSPG